jgi:hypothetical protein
MRSARIAGDTNKGQMVDTHDVCKWASRSLLLFAAADVCHVGAAVVLASPEKRTVFSVVGALVLNVALVALIVWIAVGVRQGRRLVGGLALVGTFGAMALCAVVISTTAGYHASHVLRGCQILLGVTWAMSFALLTWTYVRDVGADDR